MDECPERSSFIRMKNLTLRELRNNFSKLEVCLGEDQKIRIEKPGQPIPVLMGVESIAIAPTRKPDFAARRQAIWG